MDKKRSAFAAPDAGRMTDAELSKRLGGLQRLSAAWLLVGLAGAVSGTVCFFTVQAALLRAILVTVLFFGGVCCAVVFGGGGQKKLKALMHEQLGDFFRSEWEKTFGPDIHTPEMRIDEPFVKALHLLDGEWETCSVENFHEGSMAVCIFPPQMCGWIMCIREGRPMRASRLAAAWFSVGLSCAVRCVSPPHRLCLRPCGRPTVPAAS